MGRPVARLLFALACGLCAAPVGALAGTPGPPPRRYREPRLHTREYLDVTVAKTSKGLKVASVKRGKLKPKEKIRRYHGRFEIRLYTHGLLRDRLHFSFPLTLARQTAPAGLGRALEVGVVKARTQVRVPYAPNLTHLVVVDSRSGDKARHVLAKPKKLDSELRLPGPTRTSSFGIPSAAPGPNKGQAAAKKPRAKRSTENKRAKRSKSTRKKKSGRSR